MVSGYSEKVVEHFLHPKHLGLLTEGSVGAGERLLTGDAGHIARGDAMRLTIRLRVADETILDAGFQNFGTGMPIASASAFCSAIIGKTVDAATQVNADELDRDLNGLPELRTRQPILILDAFDSALRKLRGLPQRERGASNEPPLCTCFQVPESVIERAVRLRDLKTVDEITKATRAGAGCHTCHPDLEAILEQCARHEYKIHIPADEWKAARQLYHLAPPTTEELAANPPAAPQREARVAPDGFVYPNKSPVAEIASNVTMAKRNIDRRPWRELNHEDRVKRIEEVLEYDLRPAIRADGGDIKLVELRDDRVRVSLHGHCTNCHSALSTLKLGVEKHLQDAVWPELEVEEVF